MAMKKQSNMLSISLRKDKEEKEFGKIMHIRPDIHVLRPSDAFLMDYRMCKIINHVEKVLPGLEMGS